MSTRHNVFGEFDDQGRLISLVSQDGQRRFAGTAKVRKRKALRLFSANAQVGSGATLVYDVPAGGGYVSSITAEIPVDADGLFVVLANGNTGAALVVNAVAYSCPTDMSLKPFNAFHAANKVAGSFGGAAGLNIAAAPSADLATYVASDVTPISTKARTDDTSKTTRIVHARVSFAAANNATPLSYWSRGGTRWTSAAPRGGEVWTTISPGDINATVYGLGAPADQSGGCLIFGIGYIARNGEVRVIAGSGDSFWEGSQEGSGSRPFGVEAILESAKITGRPTEYMNMGKGQVTSKDFTDRAMAIMALYQPSEWIHEAANPNDSYTTEDKVDKQRQQLMRVLTYCEENGIRPWGMTGCPITNAGNTASGLDDAAQARLAAWNDEIKRYVSTIDLGEQASSGVLWKPGASADGLHVDQAWSEGNLVPYMATVLAG